MVVEIVWTPRSREEFKSIVEFIDRASTQYASIRGQRILDRVKILEKFPAAGRVVPEIQKANVRELILGSYRIIYCVKSETRVDIMAVHHSSMPLSIDRNSFE